MTTADRAKERRPLRSRWWLIVGVIIIIVGVVTGLFLSTGTSNARSAAPPTTSVSRGTLTATIDGSGTIAAEQSVDLPFQVSGSVTEVLVDEGQVVTAGQPLARLDTRDLELQVASAEAQLASARTRLTQVQEGNTTDSDVAAQQAQVRSAAAQVASAQAQLRSAQAQLAALRNPTASEVEAAEIRLRQAELDLQNTRDTRSASKTRAELDLDRAVQTLTQAQSRYATAVQNWQHVQDSGTDPQNPKTATGERNKVNDAQRQKYYDEFVQAEANLQSSEAAVHQSQVAFEQARQDEVTAIQQAETKVQDAQRQLNALRNPNPNEIARLEASVQQAQASINQARAGVDQANANLAKLSDTGTETDVSIQNASITQAEQSLKQAQLRVEQATLKAPFAGIVTSVNIVPGSVVSSATPVVTLIDRSQLHIDLRLSENDVARVALDQSVTMSIDALAEWDGKGTVSYISPAAESVNGVVTYRVQVAFPDDDQQVKIGMTANLSIITAVREQALLVPNTSLLPKGAGRVVQMLNADGTTREVDVQIGLSDGINTEILAGVVEGDAVVTNPNAQRTQQRSGLLP